jgi:hypothetical protein
MADPVESVVEACNELCLEGLVESGRAPRAEAAWSSRGGWTVISLAVPTPGGEESPRLTACDIDCLRLLASSDEPVSGVRARREMETRSIGVYGLATVKRALARLKRLGVVANARRGARGYYLPANAPLFRRPAG